MRKAGWVLAGVLAAVVASNGASADVKKGEFLVAPQGSLAVPVGDYPSPFIQGIPSTIKYGNYIQTGFSLSGSIERMLTTQFALGADFGININPIDETPILPLLQAASDTTSTYEADFRWRTARIGGHGRWYFQPEKRANPYLHFGTGIYVDKLQTDITEVKRTGTRNNNTRSKSTTNLGVAFGPGILFRISPDIRFSLDAIVHNVFTKDKSVRFLNVTLGMVIGVTPQQ